MKLEDVVIGEKKYQWNGDFYFSNGVVEHSDPMVVTVDRINKEFDCMNRYVHMTGMFSVRPEDLSPIEEQS